MSWNKIFGVGVGMLPLLLWFALLAYAWDVLFAFVVFAGAFGFVAFTIGCLSLGFKLWEKE